MSTRSVMSIILLLFLGAGLLKGQNGASSLTDVIIKGYEPKLFSSEPVSDKEIDIILKCGLKAPSARNRQLWKFTVVKDNTIIENLIPNFTPGNILIIISGQESPPEGANLDIDCAIATAFMYIATQSLGLGGQIYTGPLRNMDVTMNTVLQIPEGYKAITLLRVGNFDSNVDANSSASTRKTIEEVVNYR